MHADDIREYCLSKKGVTESFPFDNDTLVFKVSDKMFLLLALEKKTINNKLKMPNKKMKSLSKSKKISHL